MKKKRRVSQGKRKSFIPDTGAKPRLSVLGELAAVELADGRRASSFRYRKHSERHVAELCLWGCQQHYLRFIHLAISFICST